jgi:cytochrome b subunit of formate dehydrogenase
VLVAGHLYMAIVNPGTRPALRGMLTGRVDRNWARAHHAEWRADGD